MKTSGYRRGLCFNVWALFLIGISILSLVLSCINLNNLLNNSLFVNLAAFQYTGVIGKPPLYCTDDGFLAFAWNCGFLSIVALITGFMALGVKELLNFFNLVFLFMSGLTAFFTSIVIAVCSSMVLQCHVTLTGEIPATNLFVSIFAVLQCLFALLCFSKVLRKRWDMSSDLKYGIEPLPDPFELTVNPQNVIIVKGNNYEDSINPYSSQNDFFKAMSMNGGHFNTPYARSNLMSNANKFQMPNYAVNPSYQTNRVDSESSVIPRENRMILNAGNGARKVEGWVSNAGMAGGRGGKMGGIMAGGINNRYGGAFANPSKIRQMEQARRYNGCPDKAYNRLSTPIFYPNL